MTKNASGSTIPAPDADDVEHAYGDLAAEYAHARAQAAQSAGNPATPVWERVGDELESDEDREEG